MAVLLVVALVQAALLAAVLWTSPESRSVVASGWRALWPWGHDGVPDARAEEPLPGQRALFLDDDVRRMHGHIDRMFEEAMGRLDQQMNGLAPGLPAPPPLPPGLARPPMPADHFRYLQRDIDRLFREALQEQARLAQTRGFQDQWDHVGVSSAMELRDGQDHYLVLVNLPGVEGSNLQVSVEGRLLYIRAESPQPVARPAGLSARPAAGRRFETRLMLPGPVEAEGARAFLEDGVLRVQVPKAAAPAAKKVVVKTGPDS